MFGTRLIGGNEWQINIGFGGGGQLHLGFFRRFLQSLQRHVVVGQIDPAVFFKFGDEPVDDPLVQVVAAQMGVSVGGLDLDNIVSDF